MMLKKRYVKPITEFSFIEEEDGLLQNSGVNTGDGPDSPWDNEDGEAKSSAFNFEEEGGFTINQ